MIKKILLGILIVKTCIIHAQPVQIGTTTFDVQTTNASKSRLLVYPDGKISASWTGSSSLATTFNDRGSYFNSFNGTSWGPYPAARIEDIKSNNGEIVTILDHEVSLSNGVGNILVYKNSAIGNNDWTETAGSSQILGQYPVVYALNGYDDLFVVTANSAAPTALYYSYSSNGGESWTILNSTIPFLTPADGFGSLSTEVYQIASAGADIYVLYGSPTSDLVLLHSSFLGYDGTWDTQLLVDFPIPGYTGAGGQITDVNGDGTGDTITTNDGTHDMTLGPDGNLYIVSGIMKIVDDNAGAVGYDVVHNYGELLFYKTGLAGPEFLNAVPDWNNADGLNDPYAGIGIDRSAYGQKGFATSPGIAIDESTGNIYVVYRMQVEYTDQFDNPDIPGAQSKSDIFGIYSSDYGDSWHVPSNLTYSAYTGIENAYPFVYPTMIDGKIHVLWMQDNEPGVYNDSPADPIHENKIVYQAFDTSRFTPYIPVADFSSVVTDFGLTTNVAFTNLSAEAESYFWDFGDGFNSTLVNPSHIYPEGLFNACLTATNAYGSDTHCQTYLTTTTPVAFFSAAGDPNVSFTDLSTGGTPETWAWDFGDGFSSSLQNPTHAYVATGTYNVCLTVTNVAGSDTYCAGVTIITFPPPVAEFIYSGDPVTSFSDQSAGLVSTWHWDFGDGTTSELQNPIHTFSGNDNYTVCLTAGNPSGENTTCHIIVIDGALSADYTYSVIDPLKIAFQDISTGSPNDWVWDFGDGTVSGFQNPVHTFPGEGSFNICLSASNGTSSDSICKFLLITNVPSLSDNSTIHLGPNPATTFLQINSNPMHGIIYLENINGAVVSSNVVNGNIPFTMDVANLPRGIYTLEINAAEGYYTSKVILQ